MKANNRPQPSAEFFVAGGTLPASAPSYVSRPADEQLFNLALAGDFCYVLTTRQMGKSSLMVRTAKRLKQEGVRTAIIDLTASGRTEETWYLDFLTELSEQLAVTQDVQAWWKEHATLSAVRRFHNFLRDVVLEEGNVRVVIFVDEIDTTLELPYTDDFFAAVRAMYNARAVDEKFNQLTFVFLGVAAPADLIKDRARTPFNIGEGVVLRDFNRTDAAVLQRGLETAYPDQGQAILDRIYHWTGGHPYLTQKLCSEVVDAKRSELWTDAALDRVVDGLFLSDQAHRETNLQFVQDRILTSPRRRRLLALYAKVLANQRVANDEQSVLQNQLKLAGLVTADNGYLRVDNEIYRYVFDARWINANLPRDTSRVVAVTAVAIAIAAIGIAIAVLANQVRPMPDGFNIAVTEFVEQDAEGKLAVTEDSRTLSDYLFAAFKKESELLSPTSQPNTWGPAQIGSISGANEQQLTDNACKAAEKLNATILIYGVIASRNGSSQVAPRFCVNDKSFGYGSEIAGPLQLGQPITFVLPLNAPSTLAEVNRRLDARLSALQKVVRGLASYYVSDYHGAMSEFLQALNIPDWRPDEGHEVVYALIGATQLRLYDPQAPLAQRNEILKRASDYFAKANTLNPDYARSDIGLGSVALQQATLDSNRIDAEKLIEASSWFSKGLKSTGSLVSPYAPIEAAYGLGQVHLIGYKNQLPGWSADQARSYFEQVIAAYEANPSPDLDWFSGHAYCDLGYLAGLEKSDWAAMSTECRKAIDVLQSMPGTPPLNWIARYWAWIGQAEANNQHIESAKNAYREAIKISGVLTNTSQLSASSEEVALWQAALDRLTK